MRGQRWPLGMESETQRIMGRRCCRSPRNYSGFRKCQALDLTERAFSLTFAS